VPKVDATDFYMFRSYEDGRAEHVTLLANYAPLQDAYGGPNYFALDRTRCMRSTSTTMAMRRRTELPVPLPEHAERWRHRAADRQQDAEHPLIQAGTVTDVNSPSLQVRQTFGVTVTRGDRVAAARRRTNATGGTSFDKPVDNIGVKTLPTTPAMPRGTSRRFTSPAAACRAGFSSASARSRLRSTWHDLRLVNAPASVLLNPDLKGAAPNTIGDKNVTRSRWRCTAAA